MTSRIQEDGTGGEAKWADIDDDEDDWAPETIEWNDGTKVTLTHAESSMSTTARDKDAKDVKDMKERDTREPTTKGASPVPTPPAQPSPREPPKTLASRSQTSVGPNATVLRLGANAERQQQQAKAAAAKGTGDQSSSAAGRSPAPPPAKSPWATLPPIDRVSPINPPVQQAPPSFARGPQREQRSPDKPTNAVPTREIAADDFNRSWRDTNSNTPKELFNSQSGKYEPVTETRRGILRSDHHQMRPPALLQRPGPNEQSKPAEPSPAFQTHRTSHQDGPWMRRRTSSNVSGGSGGFGRRMSFGRGDKPQDNKREPQAINGAADRSISPGAPKEKTNRDVSPNQRPNGFTWQPRNSMAYAPPKSQIGAAQASSQDQAAEQAAVEDAIALQARIMKEKREEARQRKQEEEEREEAARRERIRLKLEQLGPPPEKPKPEDKSAAQKQESTAASSQSTAQSPPKPPAPASTGETKQYGLMKIQQPEPARRLPSPDERAREAPQQDTTGARDSQPEPEKKPDVAKPNGILTQDEPRGQAKDQQGDRPTEERNEARWKAPLNGPGQYTPWGPPAGSKLGPHASPSSNPWKPLSSDKPLGNGTFDRNLTAFSARDYPLRPVGLSDAPPQPFSGATSQPPLTIPPSEAGPGVYEPFHPIPRPRPIGPPGSQWSADSRRNATAAWNNFHRVAAKQDAEDREKFQRELNALREEGAPAPTLPNFAETWRQVRVGDQTGQRQVVEVSKSGDSLGQLPPLHAFDTPADGLPFVDNHARPFSNATGRGSRFFPPVGEARNRMINGGDLRARSPSPPPPEELSSHPVYTGDSQRPQVHLPTPKPIVKLPPKTSPPSPPASKPVTFAAITAGPPTSRSTMEASAAANTWQERINGLFGKKTTPAEKKGSLAISSASKEPLEDTTQATPAAVSLPQKHAAELLAADAGKVASREVEEEEAMFEDREAGSLPVVRVPAMAPPNAWRAAQPPPARLRPKILKPMQVHSVDPDIVTLFIESESSGKLQVVIRFPGATEPTSKTLPKKAADAIARPKSGSSHRRGRRSARTRGTGGTGGSSKRQGPSGRGKGSERPKNDESPATAAAQA